MLPESTFRGHNLVEIAARATRHNRDWRRRETTSAGDSPRSTPTVRSTPAEASFKTCKSLPEGTAANKTLLNRVQSSTSTPEQASPRRRSTDTKSTPRSTPPLRQPRPDKQLTDPPSTSSSRTSRDESVAYLFDAAVATVKTEATDTRRPWPANRPDRRPDTATSPSTPPRRTPSWWGEGCSSLFLPGVGSTTNPTPSGRTTLLFTHLRHRSQAPPLFHRRNGGRRGEEPRIWPSVARETWGIVRRSYS